MSEIGRVAVVAPISVSASGAGAVASALVSGDVATWCISEIAEVLSSVAASIRGVAFGAGAANDVRGCCEADSLGIDDVVSSADPLTGVVALSLATIASACEDDRSVSPCLNDNAEPAAEGLGLGTGIANGVAEAAILARTAACCAGWPSARMYQHLC